MTNRQHDELKKLLTWHGYPNRTPAVYRRSVSHRTALYRVGYVQCGCLTILGEGKSFAEAKRAANVQLTSEVLWEKKNGLRP